MNQAWIDKAKSLEIETRPFIDGKYVSSIDGEFIKKTSSVDNSEIPPISSCNEKDIHSAFVASKRAYDIKTWRGNSLNERKKILFNLAKLMEQHKEELALLDTLETGRSFKNYFFDSIPKAIEAIQYFAEAVDKNYDYSISPSPHAFATITKEPLGVVGIITPWNDPLVVAAWKFTPALLMGNSVIIKPAEQSTYSILRVAMLAKEAGIPDGVLNIVPGHGETAGKALALHSDIRGIFFTGSSEVGKKILGYASDSGIKKIGLECGGKSPFIVSRNCKRLEKSAQILAKSIFYNQGQICSAPSRLIIDNNIKEKFITHLENEAYKYIPSNPFHIESEVGCVVSKEQKERILEYIERAKDEGCTKFFSPSTENHMLPVGPYVIPTIFEISDPNSSVAQEEIFGPVLAIIGTNSMQEAIDIANNSKYGLAASVWTNDLDEAHHISRELQAGIVHINSYGEDDNTVPFGGIKDSGIGKDKSILAFDEYSYTKTIWTHFDTPGSSQ
jgi:acyl-CoA reductase-like NAD-dependent aldehyde dehydrogenase